MDTTMDSGNVADSSIVHVKFVGIGKVGAAVNLSPAPSSVVDTSVVERKTGVTPLVLEEVVEDGATGGGATDPLLPPEGVAGGAGESIITESTMPTSDLGPLKSRKNTVVEGEPSSATFQGVNVRDYTEMFNQERENDKSAKDFYTLLGIVVKFQRFDVPVEGLPLLEKILSK